MKFNLVILLLLGTLHVGFSQNLNMVIEVNERLVTSEIAGTYLNFEKVDGSTSRYLGGYHPGELILQKGNWEKINPELTKKIILIFDYYVLNGKWHTSEILELKC